jgi:sigma-B regulation protein RsbU (phosphoserine phosphatase)
MIYGFLAGFISGLISAAYWIFLRRRTFLHQDEQIQLLKQEKEIVLQFVHNMVEAIGEGVDQQELYRRLLHSSVLSTDALCAAFFEYKNGKLRGVAMEGLFPPQKLSVQPFQSKLISRTRFIENALRSEVFEIGEGVVGASAKSRTPLFIEDAESDPRIPRQQDPVLQIRSLIVVPIQFRDNLIGVLAVANPADGGAFSDSDFSLIQSIAEQAGLALHNLHLMEIQIEKNVLDMDLSLASNIQGMLLPASLPEMKGLDIDARYLPAQKVGGDLFDIFVLDDHRIGIAIADVSGKGVPASLMMTMCQTHMRTITHEMFSASKVLSELNRMLNQGIRSDMFITMIYVIVDTHKNEIQLARAGHELPFIYRHKLEDSSSERVQSLFSTGMALGMVPPELFDSVIADITIPFNTGDILLLYTDGVTESVNADGVEYSSSRLSDTLRYLHDNNAVLINQGIMDTVKRFSGGSKQTDDITLITLKSI